MIVPVTHILPLTEVRRSRMLSGRGEVLVRVGQRVNSTDVVAEEHITGGHVLLDIRRALGVANLEDVNRLITHKPGEHFDEGDILAQTGGILSKVVRAPSNGIVVTIQRGQMLLEKPGSKNQLLAGINGTVTEILPDRGVVIISNGALIQAVWGNSKTNFGVLLVPVREPSSTLTRSSLDLTMRGAVILAGTVEKADTLEAAGEIPVRGLILASLDSTLIPVAARMDYPIILTEGFGSMPMNSAAFQLLLTHEKRDISVNAAWNPGKGEKPEILIPLPAAGQPPAEIGELATGKKVRVLFPPYQAQTGIIVSLPPGQSTLPNGLRAPAANIRLENNQVVIVPIANLDMLE